MLEKVQKQRTFYGYDLPQTWKDKYLTLAKEAEAARFSIYMVGLVSKKLTKDWTPTQRAADCRCEVASLRAFAGDQHEKEWIPAALYDKCMDCVLKRGQIQV